jgi:hypothetical protein
MRRTLLLVTAALLSACGSKPASSPANVAGNEQPAVSAPATTPSPANQEAAANVAKSGNAGGVLPPANAELRFVGTWAASQANCKSRPWRFTARELTVVGGPHCSFYNVAKAPGGYDVAAECPTKKPVHTDLIKLRFAESAQAMLVESNAIQPTGLIYCGR